MRVVDVAKQMNDSRAHCVIVVDGDQVPVGVFGRRDLVRSVAFELPIADLTVSDVMVVPVITVPDGASHAGALQLMRTHGLARLPVVDPAGRLVGLVAEADLMRYESQILHRRGEKLEQVLAQSRILRESNSRLQALSLEDPLMGIGNRRAMERELKKTASAARRYKRRYSVLLLDVDHFKKYNDLYGHQAGDEALRRVAGALKATVRDCDIVFRYGGEEILIVAPETGLKGALILGQRCNLAVEGLGVEHAGSAYGVLTVTVGVACWDLDDSETEWNDLVNAADEALYSGKTAGRNRVLPYRHFGEGLALSDAF
jgi:diguanylate cyclase (GGDEF)-like protein